MIRLLAILIACCCALGGARTDADDGPVVAVFADSRTDGPAGQLAIRQIRHWPVACGQMIVAEDALQAQSRLARKERRPDWLLVLRESYDERQSIPAATGRTLLVASPRDKSRHVVDRALKALADPAAKPGAAWRSEPLSRQDLTRYVALVGDRAGIIVVNTSAKRQKSNRLWSRVRQQRIAAHTILRELGVIGENTSPDRMTPAGKRPRKGNACLAIYDGPGAVSSSGHDPLWILRSLRHLPWLDASLIGPDEIRAGALEQFDAVLFGGGGSSSQAKSLAEKGRNRVRKFVRNGGGYVGICAGAFLASCNRDIHLGIINARMTGGRGKAIVPLKFDEAAERLVATTGTHKAKYSGGPRAMIDAERKDLPKLTPLARFVRKTPTAGKPARPVAIAYAEYGKGKVIVFSPHCERYPGQQEAFWRALATCCSADLSGVELPTTPDQP